MTKLVAAILALNILFVSPFAYSQADKANEISTTGPRRNLGYIVFAGVAGAIMGLSTLSFYGRPQDRLSNIAVGAAIGVIGGALYTTYKAATEPKDFYNWRETEPETWALMDTSYRQGFEQTPSATFSFEF